jgi:TPR repeat protein
MLKHPIIAVVGFIAFADLAHAAEIQRGSGNASHLPIIKASESEDVRRTRVRAEQGNVDAQFILGVRYAQGQGVVQDHTEAVRWYRLAAEQGDADAQWKLGWMYRDGRGISQNDVLAHMWFNLAAARGSEPAPRALVSSEREMTPDQIAEARRMAQEWKPK